MRILHIQAQLPSKTGSGVYFTNIIKGLETVPNKLAFMGATQILNGVPSRFFMKVFL